MSLDIDRHLLLFFEKRLLWIQDRMGIPKWKLIRVLTIIYVGYFVSLALFKPFEIFAFHLGFGFLIGWSWWDPNRKKEQAEADRKQMMIENRFSQLWFSKLIRVGIISIIIIPRLVTRTLLLNLLVQDILFFIMFYFGALHTYPMIGPTFKEKLKDIFHVSKPAVSES